MYHEDFPPIPADKADLWEVLREHFFHARKLLETPLETKEQALDIDFQSTMDARRMRKCLGLIRYRNISEENDQREYCLDMGLKLIPYIEKALDARELTSEFVQQWGKLMFCHGYIACHVFDDSDDLAQIRGGLKRGRQRSKNAQRKWIAHIMIPLIDGGTKRGQAESEVVKYVQTARENEALRGGFSRDWFDAIITHGELAATYDAKHFAIKTMRRLMEEPTDDLPPIPTIP